MLKKINKFLKTEYNLIKRALSVGFNSVKADIPPEVYKIFFGILIIVSLGGIFVHFAEVGASSGLDEFKNSFWWALVTITTTGYGDYAPKSFEGRIVAVGMMIGGIILMSLLTAAISSILVSKRIQANRGLMEVKIKNHIIICGYYPTINSLIKSIYKKDKNSSIVILNDQQQEDIDVLLSEYSSHHIHFVRGNFSKEIFLEKAKIRDCESVIILPDISGNKPKDRYDELILVATLAVKEIDPSKKVFGHVTDPDLVPHLRRAGIDGVMVTDEFSGEMMASYINNPGSAQAVRQMFGIIGHHPLVTVPVNPKYFGKTYNELLTDMKQTTNLLVIGLVSTENSVDINAILSNDMSAIDQFIQKKFTEAGIGKDKREEVKLKLNPPLDHIILEGELALVLGV